MKDKYVKFSKPYPHYQVAKFNGTKGLIEMTTEMVGVYQPNSNTYRFPEVNNVIPEFIAELLLGLKKIGRTIFMDGQFEKFNDEDDKAICERFEARLFIAKNQIDVDVAKLYFVAAQQDRLLIKASVQRLMNSEQNVHECDATAADEKAKS
jgi:hypothetical protein